MSILCGFLLYHLDITMGFSRIAPPADATSRQGRIVSCKAFAAVPIGPQVPSPNTRTRLELMVHNGALDKKCSLNW